MKITTLLLCPPQPFAPHPLTHNHNPEWSVYLQEQNRTLIIRGHSAREGGCVFSFERGPGSCHSSWCRNVFSKQRASAGFTEFPNTATEVKGNTRCHCWGWCCLSRKSLAAPSKARANGWSEITKQLPDIINGQNLLGGDQMLLNGKHLVDIFLWLPRCAETQYHVGPHTAQGNVITLASSLKTAFPCFAMYEFSFSRPCWHGSSSSPNLLFCLWSDSVAYSDT